MARRNKPEAGISPAEAERAIYIDFEGFVGHPPSLLGVLIGDALEQIVLDPRLRGAAEAKNLRITTLQESITDLLATSRYEDRLIVAYTQHEKIVIQEHAGIDLTGPYRDARMIALYWKNVCYSKKAMKGRGLKDFLELIDYPRSAHLGKRESTNRIRAVADMLARKGKYQELSSGVKAKWTKLLHHNEIDCRGMRALVLRAAKELSAAKI